MIPWNRLAGDRGQGQKERYDDAKARHDVTLRRTNNCELATRHQVEVLLRRKMQTACI
jgi:hypothetical protein